MATTLAITHSIFLTREQRYALHAGEAISVIGISLPVWYYKGITSEPAIEVFARYNLCKKTDAIFINPIDDGYEVNLSPCRQNMIDELPKNTWIPLSQKEQSILLMEDSPCLDNILDYKDKGLEWLAFKQFAKIDKNNKLLNVVHFVEIKKIEDLNSTLC